MATRGDEYRLRGAEMFALAEQNEHFREEFENLAMSYMRLAEQADRNVQMEDHPEQLVQQQQRQPKDKVDG